jgi:ankyrin repeat protein
MPLSYIYSKSLIHMAKIALDVQGLRRIAFSPMTTRQLTQELERIAQGHQITQIDSLNGATEPSLPWRYPPQHCTRKTAAALALSFCHVEGFGVEKSSERAFHWAHQAASAGHTLAMALCSTLSAPNSGTNLDGEVFAWIKTAAINGSLTARMQLKSMDKWQYEDSMKHFRSIFWMQCHNIPEIWRTVLLSSEALEFRLDRLLNETSDMPLLGVNHDSPLHCAAMCGSLQAARHLVEKHKMEVNGLNGRAETPLFLACRSGHFEVARFLLRYGANAQLSTDRHENALHWLSSFDDELIYPIAKALTDAGAAIEEDAERDSSYTDSDSDTFFHRWVSGSPLRRAVASGNKTAIVALMGVGADPGRTTKRWSPIDQAALYRMADTLELLLQHCPSYNVNFLQPNNSGAPAFTLLHRAIRSVSKGALSYILGPAYESALRDTILVLLRYGARTSHLPAGVQPPLEYAVLFGECEAAEILLQNGAVADLEAVDRANHAPLTSAILLVDEEMCTVLLRHGADIRFKVHYKSTTQFSALHMCTKAWHTSPRIAQQLVDHGHEVDVSSDHTSAATPLLGALLNNTFDLAHLLLSRGARIDFTPPGTSTGDRGNTLGELLFYPPCRQTFHALRFLLSHPISAPTFPFIVHTPGCQSVFHALCARLEIRRHSLPSDPDFLPVFNLLRSKFPNPSLLNHTDIHGETALHNAVFDVYPEAVAALLHAGADPTIPVRLRDMGPRQWLSRALVGPHAFPLHGKTVLDMVREGIFCPIPEHVKTNRRELGGYVRRREEVRRLFEAFLE